MEIISLASGSSGNAYVVRQGKGSLLLDAGLSGKYTLAALAAVGIDPASVTAILVTHEHHDHIAGAGILSRRLKVPLYMTEGTWRGAAGRLGKIAPAMVEIISPGTAFVLNDLEILPLSTCHDTIEPVNYIFDGGGCRGAVLTDTGCVGSELLAALATCDALVLEANHDGEMLAQGPYPWPLKRRIASDRGHLSNLQAARVLADLVAKGRITQVHLGHLSAVNNSRELARGTVAKYLADRGMGAEPVYRSLKVLPRDRWGPMLQVK